MTTACKRGSADPTTFASEPRQCPLGPMPVTMLNEARVPIECKNENCGMVHLYLVIDRVPNYLVRCLDCQQSIDLTSDQWTDAVNATIEYYKAMIF